MHSAAADSKNVCLYCIFSSWHPLRPIGQDSNADFRMQTLLEKLIGV